MASVTVSASCVVYSNGTNYTVTLPLTNPAPTATPVKTQDLVAGPNTVTVPTGVLNGVWVIPPPGSANAKTYKGVTGDTGITTNPASWAFIPIASGSFVITSGGSETVTLVWD